MDGLGSNLNLTVSNNSGDGAVMCDSWTSMYMFLYVSWSGDDLGSYDGSWCSKTSITSSKTSITSCKSVSSSKSCSQQFTLDSYRTDITWLNF